MLFFVCFSFWAKSLAAVCFSVVSSSFRQIDFAFYFRARSFHAHKIRRHFVKGCKNEYFLDLFAARCLRRCVFFSSGHFSSCFFGRWFMWHMPAVLCVCFFCEKKQDLTSYIDEKKTKNIANWCKTPSTNVRRDIMLLTGFAIFQRRIALPCGEEKKTNGHRIRILLWKHIFATRLTHKRNCVRFCAFSSLLHPHYGFVDPYGQIGHHLAF